MKDLEQVEISLSASLTSEKEAKEQKIAELDVSVKRNMKLESDLNNTKLLLEAERETVSKRDLQIWELKNV